MANIIIKRSKLNRSAPLKSLHKPLRKQVKANKSSKSFAHHQL